MAFEFNYPQNQATPNSLASFYPSQTLPQLPGTEFELPSIGSNALTGLGAGGLSTQLGAQGGGGSFWDSLNLFGKDGNAGNLSGILQGLGGLASAYTGYKQLGLGEDIFDFKKKSYLDNYNATRTTTNNRIADRAIATYGAQNNQVVNRHDPAVAGKIAERSIQPSGT